MNSDRAIALVSEATGYSASEITSEDDAETLPLWDSVAHINIVMAIEAELGRSLNTDEIIDITSIAGIQALLQKSAGC
ncbi:MAG: acyl carrier protein [Pseudomonadota bacterium]